MNPKRGERKGQGRLKGDTEAAYIPRWRPIESLCNIVPSLSVPAEEENFVLDIRGRVLVETDHGFVESFPGSGRGGVISV
jgi:hypothetical protein